MNGLHGIIFSYEQEPGLRELAERRMPASIPFGGRYRVVDFMLSNLHAAGITDVGVVLHGNYQSLLDHIGNGKTWDMARKYGGLRILPPFADTRAYRSGEFRGKMEALAGVRSYLQGIRQDYVVLSDSDLIINLPLADVFAAHLESGADITAVCLLMREIRPDQVIVSPISVGSGTVRCAHGILPVPAPATALLLEGMPIHAGNVQGELCTPTGAALLAHFGQMFGSMPLMRTKTVGYGIGKREFPAANCVRAFWGEADESDLQCGSC